ncbi:DUF459 domain-containing protein [Solidesulfovibrio sp.]|uniref:DUF459 domain-containing protein n=1 Tax=Solidesulfovibrio sp. TaxID=2910990 RepID=UPI002639E6B0|nr:DUF459 domain-containing protein [Solidesulfovibrio sp.]
MVPRPAPSSGRAGSPVRRGRRGLLRLAARLVPACALCVLCLLGAACSSGDEPPKAERSDLSPTDIFSRRAPKPTQPAEPAEPAQTARTRRFLVVGDSLSISLGEQLERALVGAPGLDFARDGTKSTGLTRPELLDWPARLRERVAREAPDIVVVMLGANDVMPVEGPDGTRIYFNNPAWAEAYAAKAREIVAICRAANPKAHVYWMGVPSMGEASLAAGIRQVNDALSGMCAATDGCRFVDAQAPFSDPEGRFSRHARDRATGETVLLRTPDGVHLTDAGAKLLAGVALAVVAEAEKLPPSAGVDELRAYARDVRPVAEAAPEPAREPAAAKARPSGKIYAVKKGDTILSIARKLGVPAVDLAAVNPGADSTRLSLGQELRIPQKRKR